MYKKIRAATRLKHATSPAPCCRQPKTSWTPGKQTRKATVPWEYHLQAGITCAGEGGEGSGAGAQGATKNVRETFKINICKVECKH